MYRISVILGTRPEAIKMAPVILAFGRKPFVECRVCVTAQHRQMLDQVLTVFNIAPDCDLNLMRTDQLLAAFAGRAIKALSGYLTAERPDLVLVQGDTATVFCAALAAFYQRIPVGHVEAGLRTWNMDSPWPEEANRVLTSRLAKLHFAPTEWSKRNLVQEGIANERIFVTGNTVIDALFFALRKIGAHPPRLAGLPEWLQPKAGTRARRNNSSPRVVLITGHRRENFGEGFENICRAIAELASRFPDVHFVYPVHLNPNVREPVNRVLGLTHRTIRSRRSALPQRLAAGRRANLHLIEPLPYLPFIALMNRASLILTDSGGIQEEAPTLGKPVLVMRDTTERPEAVRAGTVRLVGTKRETIINETSALLSDRRAYAAMVQRTNPYGNGTAAAQIARHCVRFLRKPKSAEP
jgi:UDP-N-acetylglucosamine 2-epimerase (non-hydrolysing)